MGVLERGLGLASDDQAEVSAASLTQVRPWTNYSTETALSLESNQRGFHNGTIGALFQRYWWLG